MTRCWCEMVNGRRHVADGCPTHDVRRLGSPAGTPTETGRPTGLTGSASSAGTGEEANARTPAGEPNRFLLARLAWLEDERRKLRRRLRAVENSREMWRVRAGVRPRVAADRVLDIPRHGTRTSYNRGCQCVPCRQAESEYQHNRYLRTKAANG